MDSRKAKLLKARPEILFATVTGKMTVAEKFQNQTLRPIIKLQKDLFLQVFQDYIQKHKTSFWEFSIEKRLEYIEKSIQKDVKLRNSFKGMVIGQFTLEEYNIYAQNASSLNRRMMNLIKERLQDHIQLLEGNAAYQ